MQPRDILHRLPYRIILIFYKEGSRGHAVTRILSCHQESHWEPLWSCNDESADPLSFPELVSGFTFTRKVGLTLKKASTLVHTGTYLEIGQSEEDIRSSFSAVYNLLSLLKDKKSNKYIFLNTHPWGVAQGFEKVERPKKVILYSKSETEGRYSFWKDNFGFSLETFSPQEKALNINIDDLFSTDYKTFEEEYLKAVHYFGFTPRINAVRSFVLRYIERERYIFNS